MEFISKLVEIDSGSMGFAGRRYRLFDKLDISDTVVLSIQASYAHYCTPRKTVPLTDYSTMEFAIIKDGEFVSAGDVSNNQELITKLDEYFDGSVYTYVSVELIEELYQDLRVK